MAEALDPAIPDDIERLAQEVLAQACDREVMLATAESCTGGLLASLLTDIPGKSHAFERGFVTYSDEAKHELLGVSRAILEGDGAVSEAAARAMAEGALAASRAHLAVSITGFAEAAPDGPAGLVHFACARRGGATRHRMERFGDVGRAEVRLAALRVGLKLLRASLNPRARAA
ncbi:MAG: CinA family protein [Phenylobacterium sp.]|uniref:CinA family protein n=1 Tax=Phenylobacterium sp. TaxID=1871053 RepID=UPI00121688F8|nr:CinA family protein [Phenylobacterium sp.]TAJ69722.1 MAG: CinA family protein [Phenylobacterium sp.]